MGSSHAEAIILRLADFSGARYDKGGPTREANMKAIAIALMTLFRLSANQAVRTSPGGR
jgi:hypothetical protein